MYDPKSISLCRECNKRPTPVSGNNGFYIKCRTTGCIRNKEHKGCNVTENEYQTVAEAIGDWNA